VITGDFTSMNTMHENKAFDFTAATFNLRAIQFPDLRSKWSKRCKLIADMIESSGASVVGVQEMLPVMKRDLKKMLGGYSFIGCGRSFKPSKNILHGEHTDLLAKRSVKCRYNETFWLSREPDKPGSRLFASVFPRICTVADFEVNPSEGIVRVYNTHLDHLSGSVRMLQINIILRHMEMMQKIDPRPTVLMGDFNCTPDSREIKAVTENGTLPLRAAYTGNEYSFKYPKFFGTRLLDHIFVSDEIEVKNAYIDKDSYHGSDHYPVIASLAVSV